VGKHIPVLIGGSDEQEVCAQLVGMGGGDVCILLFFVFIMAGQLTLPETAAVLKAMKTAVVSGDTGQVTRWAMGTRVVGLDGQTFPARSGPYGCLDIVVDQEICQCHDQKVAAMLRLKIQAVYARIMLPEISIGSKANCSRPCSRE